MQALLEAMHTQYQGSALDTSLTGGLHIDEAPQGTATPYGVVQVATGAPDHFFGETVHERMRVQVDLYAMSNAAALDLYEDCRNTFDRADLTVTGYRFVDMRRIEYQKMRAGLAHRVMVEYRVHIEEV